jgi:hypothetical protein
MAEKRAKSPIFETNMLPQKMYPQNWRQYWRHNRNPVKEFWAYRAPLRRIQKKLE